MFSVYSLAESPRVLTLLVSSFMFYVFPDSSLPMHPHISASHNHDGLATGKTMVKAGVGTKVKAGGGGQG